MQEQIDQRITQLQTELQRADEELSKLRPRVQYLEQTMLRLDGALTVLQELRAAAPVNGRDAMPDALAALSSS